MKVKDLLNCIADDVMINISDNYGFIGEVMNSKIPKNHSIFADCEIAENGIYPLKEGVLVICIK